MSTIKFNTNFTLIHLHSFSTAIFNYAQAGFDAGDGINFKILPHSRTPDINKLVNELNVDVPGLVVYRIGTFDIEAGGCEGNASAANTTYSYAPNHSSQHSGAWLLDR